MEMRKPNKKNQLEDIEKQYKDCLIDEDEYFRAKKRVLNNYYAWVNRNKK